jgi:hypothetical protein
MSPVDDQSPVETLGANGADEAFGVGVCLSCTDRATIAELTAVRTRSGGRLIDTGSESGVASRPRSPRLAIRVGTAPSVHLVRF